MEPSSDKFEKHFPEFFDNVYCGFENIPSDWESLLWDACSLITIKLTREDIPLSTFKVVQVKSKFDTFRVYYNIVGEDIPEHVSTYVHTVIGTICYIADTKK